LEDSKLELTAEDYLAIQQLYIRMAYAADMNDPDAYTSCFTEDGEYVGFREGGQPHAKGHDELRALLARSTAAGENGYHWNTSPLIEPTNYGASGRCYLVHVIAHDNGSFEDVRHALYYRDEVVKVDGRWLFRRRNTTALPEGRKPSQ
jgi:hypothetical protein